MFEAGYGAFHGKGMSVMIKLITSECVITAKVMPDKDL